MGHYIKQSVGCLTFASAFILLCPSSRADLILTFTGTPGSSVVNWEASGSVAIAQAVSAHVPNALDTNSYGPVGSSWITSYNDNIGDPLIFTRSADNDNVVLGWGGVSYRRNGVEFEVFDRVDFDPSGVPGNDDVELETTAGSQSYPGLAVNDVLSWVGNGTLTLDGGTFDTEFALGTYSNAINGGNFTVIFQNQAAAVPEPGSLLCLAGVTGLVAMGRRQRA